MIHSQKSVSKTYAFKVRSNAGDPSCHLYLPEMQNIQAFPIDFQSVSLSNSDGNNERCSLVKDIVL